MRKELAQTTDDDLQPEYDLSRLKGGVRGKYYQQAKAGAHLVLIEADLTRAFPDEESVNRALRLLLSAANAAITGSHRNRALPDKRTRSTRKKAGHG